MSRSGTNLRTSTAAPLGARPHIAGGDARHHRPYRGPSVASLTTRENEVVDLVCEGHNNESISHQMDITEDTVKRHLSTVFVKMNLNTRTELAVKVLKERHAAELATVLRNAEAIRNNTWADLQSN